MRILCHQKVKPVNSLRVFIGVDLFCSVLIELMNVNDDSHDSLLRKNPSENDHRNAARDSNGPVMLYLCPFVAWPQTSARALVPALGGTWWHMAFQPLSFEETCTDLLSRLSPTPDLVFEGVKLNIVDHLLGIPEINQGG